MKTPRPVIHDNTTFLARQHGRSFVWHVREARRIGALARRFRERSLREACPGWAWNTYVKYPERHPELFLKHGNGHYSLVEDEESPGGCIRSRQPDDTLPLGRECYMSKGWDDSARRPAGDSTWASELAASDPRSRRVSRPAARKPRPRRGLRPPRRPRRAPQ